MNYRFSSEIRNFELCAEKLAASFVYENALLRDIVIITILSSHRSIKGAGANK